MFIEGVTAGQDVDVCAYVTLVWRDVPDRAVVMLAELCSRTFWVS
jgi:hypothetical protein